MHKIIALILCTALLLGGCTKPAEPLSKTEFLLDTVVTITLYEGGNQSVLEEAFSICRTREQQLSRHLADSEIGRLNREGTGTVSAETAALLQLASLYSRQSGGAFDSSIGALTSLWDFKAETVPDAQAVAAALETVGEGNLLAEGRQITLQNGAQIDLGGIAKGAIADEMAAYLREQGVTSAILNLGGNVTAIGQKGGSPFRVGIQNPFDEAGDFISVLELADKTVSTSGTYQRYFEAEGVRYHHLLDPATGYPAQNGLVSVTVIADTGAMADAYSTAAFILGRQAGSTFLKSQGVQGIFVTENGQIERVGFE